MMKKIIYMLLASLTVVGCYKNDLKNTDFPDKGSITFDFDWSNLHAEDSTPKSFEIYVGENKYSITEPYAMMILEPQSQQEFLIHNLPLGMIITDGIASLMATAVRSAPIDPVSEPQSLYYATTTADITADQRQTIALTPKRGTASLTLKLDYDASLVVNIKEVKIELSGIAATRNLRTGALTDERVLTQYPILDPNKSELVLNYNILGTLGAEQMLSITLTTQGNQTRTTRSNLTTQLADFNSAMNPITLTGDMNLIVNIEAEGDIINWDFVKENDATAE